MLCIQWVIILGYYSILLAISSQQIIHNPIISDKEFNPINYILILQNNSVMTISSHTLKIQNDFIKLFHQSYIFDQPIFLCKDESNNFFLLFKDKYYNAKLSSEKEIERVSLKKYLREDIKYLGYITCIKSDSFQLSYSITLHSTKLNEILIYGKLDDEIVFYSSLKDKYYFFNVGDIDEQISCKLVNYCIYVRLFSLNNNIKISIFALLISSEMKKLYTEKVNNFEGYKNAILYDTSDSYYKILCAKKKDINSIKCLAINIILISWNLFNNDYFTIEFIELKNDYQLLFSYQEDNCNFTIYQSEYLLCCGKKDSIFCDRKDKDLNLVNNFDIGKLSNDI